MKDEYKGIPINKFVGLKSKMYSIVSENNKECSKAKGVNISNEFNEYKNILLEKKIIRHKRKRIQSKKHKIGTYEVNKISWSCFYDKRFVLDDEITTVAYVHKDFKN